MEEFKEAIREMEGIESVHEVLELLLEKTLDAFPECTSASFHVEADGYLSISVTQWNEDYKTPAEMRKRRELFNQSKIDGDWTEDKSESLNSYFKKLGVLLEGKA